jgi:hypothetical protein
MARRPKKQKNDSMQEFTTRSVMSLVQESSELIETTQRLTAVIAALALAHGVSTKV